MRDIGLLLVEPDDIGHPGDLFTKISDVEPLAIDRLIESPQLGEGKLRRQQFEEHGRLRFDPLANLAERLLDDPIVIERHRRHRTDRTPPGPAAARHSAQRPVNLTQRQISNRNQPPDGMPVGRFEPRHIPRIRRPVGRAETLELLEAHPPDTGQLIQHPLGGAVRILRLIDQAAGQFQVRRPLLFDQQNVQLVPIETEHHAIDRHMGIHIFHKPFRNGRPPRLDKYSYLDRKILSDNSLNRNLLYKIHYLYSNDKTGDRLISKTYPPRGYCTSPERLFYSMKESATDRRSPSPTPPQRLPEKREEGFQFAEEPAH